MQQTVPFQIKETGLVKGIKKNIVRVSGLPSCMGGQVVEFASGIKGMIIGFTQDEVLVLVLGDEAGVRTGELVYSKAGSFKVPVGENFLGRVVSALGEPCDAGGAVRHPHTNPIFRQAPGTVDRGQIDQQLYSGIKIIDTFIPIAKGQKELIIGDRVTGKTTIAQDIILNQRDKDVICIYCSIGKSTFDLSKTVRLFDDRDVFRYGIIVAATASSSVGEQYLAPYTASALGEYFMYQGKDVVVVFDDLTKHGWAYREISLLLERSPGREAYPGDIFYIHSQLLERAGKLREELGSGSMTFFPIIETHEGDITGYIPSNLISMTDGQIYLSSSLFSEGFRPAVDLKLSVSTVGVRVQEPLLKELSKRLSLEYVQYRQLLSLAKLSVFGRSKAIEDSIKRGQIIKELLAQDKNAPQDIAEMAVLFYAFKENVLDDLNDNELKKFKKEIYHFIYEAEPGLIRKLREEKTLSSEAVRGLNRNIREYFKRKSQSQRVKVSKT